MKWLSRATVRKTLADSPTEQAVVRFEVRDEGGGMAPDVLARAGNPFFTTKEPGRGMGLGLFLARTVLAKLGGRLEIESREGAGTSVLFELPLAGE